MSRPYTQEEMRAKFIESIKGYVRYWESVGAARGGLEGLAFSILCMLDGVSLDLPAFEIVPTPHPTDEAFLKGEGENWFPTIQPELSEKLDALGIHGNAMLHELFYAPREKPELPEAALLGEFLRFLFSSPYGGMWWQETQVCGLSEGDVKEVVETFMKRREER